MRWIKVRGAIVAGLFVAAFLARCSHDETPAPPAAPSGEALAALHRADAADDKTDKVVEKCVTCKLHMIGKSEHTAHYGDYQLNFCSDYCKTVFENDPEKALLSLN